MSENIEAGNFNMEKKLHSVHYSMFRNVLKSFTIVAKKKGINLIYEGIERAFFEKYENKSWTIDIDMFRVDQVVRNFMTNALKFSPKGSNITLRISIQEVHEHAPVRTKRGRIGSESSNYRETQREDDGSVSANTVRTTAQLVVDVTDEGPGIDPKNQPKLFEQVLKT